MAQGAAAVDWMAWENAVSRVIHRLSAVAVTLLLGACAPSSSVQEELNATDALVGAWRSQIHFSSGAFAAMKDLEFMYVFNQGGTLTESSNYDAAPPVPPAYGIWKTVGVRQFEAKYLFYVTRPPAKLEDITGGGGWMPAGYGEFVERITLTADGKSFTSNIKYTAFDQAGKPVEGAGEATGRGARMIF
jgi:hypothetical protein